MAPTNNYNKHLQANDSWKNINQDFKLMNYKKIINLNQSKNAWKVKLLNVTDMEGFNLDLGTYTWNKLMHLLLFPKKKKKN